VIGSPVVATIVNFCVAFPPRVAGRATAKE
jgi:hypothetical protein